MKGLVFTEFLELVEDKFGIEVVDHIINKSDLESDGVYTAIGTYHSDELHNLVQTLSDHIGVSANDLIYTYGNHFFSYLTRNHSNIFEMYASPVDLLKSVENHIHVQVKKIYPEADLPTFEIVEVDDKNFEMIYISSRGLYKFAQALIEQTFNHYKKNLKISYTKLSSDGNKVKFMISHEGDK